MSGEENEEAKTSQPLGKSKGGREAPAGIRQERLDERGKKRENVGGLDGPEADGDVWLSTVEAELVAGIGVTAGVGALSIAFFSALNSILSVPLPHLTLVGPLVGGALFLAIVVMRYFATRRL